MTEFRCGTKQPGNLYKITDEHPEGERFAFSVSNDDGPEIARALNLMQTGWETLTSQLDEAIQIISSMGEAAGSCNPGSDGFCFMHDKPGECPFSWATRWLQEIQ